MLVHWWETVPPLSLLFRLALGGDNGSERFCGVQPDCSRLGWRGEVGVCPTTELGTRAIVRANREWSRNDSWRLDCDGLEEG